MNAPTTASQCAAQTLEAILRASEAYRRYVPNRSLFFFEMFLLVAARNSIRPSEIARTLGTARPSVTTALNNLGEGGRRLSSLGAINFGLGANVVEWITDPSESRAKLIGLTSKGSDVAAEMAAAMQRPRE